MIDPDGRKVVPHNSFMNSQYGVVYEKLSSNSVYSSITSGYASSSVNNLHLDVNMNESGFAAGVCQVTNSVVNGIVVAVNAQTYYGEPNGRKQNEIGMVKTLLHESIHAKNALEGIPNLSSHDGFNRETLLNGLKEYNSTNNLGYSDTDLETISWSGLENSKEFDSYIQNIAKQNGTTSATERRNHALKMDKLIYVEPIE